MTCKPQSIFKSYKKGPIMTHKPWSKPSFSLFYFWLLFFVHYIVVYDIDVEIYICGKFIENPKETWDIDIILTKKDIDKNDMTYLTKIKNLMIFGMQMGHDIFNILMDIQFYFPIDHQMKDTFDDYFWFSPQNFKEHGQIKLTRLVVFDTVYKNDEIIWNIHEYSNVCKLMDNLYQFDSLSPSTKHINRIHSGIFYKKPLKVL
jgi:hypothetical protein